jgi:hypothetical protein
MGMGRDMAQPFEDGEGEIRRRHLVRKALADQACDFDLMIERIHA